MRWGRSRFFVAVKRVPLLYIQLCVCCPSEISHPLALVLRLPYESLCKMTLNSDAVALLALIVSLVALLIAFLQVVQQYAATAYDYRRCSARTMGGWSKYTNRVFVLGEIRFEITFAVPHIELNTLKFLGGKRASDCCIVI